MNTPPAAPPSDVMQAFKEAVRLHSGGRVEEAAALYAGILAVQPRHFGALHLSGIAASQRGDFAAALASIDAALAVNPNAADAHNNRGNVLKELGRLADALLSYDRAAALKPDYAEAFNNRGNVLKDLRRPEEALASYDRAIAIRPGYAEAFNNRGSVLEDMQRLEDALASYESAIALKPDYPGAFNNRGNALRALSRPEEALASYDRALALRPDYAEALSSRGIALFELKRFDEALASYARAIALKPDYAEAYSNRGIALYECNRIDEALEDYARAIALKPDYADAFYNRGIAQAKRLRFDEALASLDAVLALKPDDVSAIGNRGGVLCDLLRMDEALAEYERALALKPDASDILYNYGVALLNLLRFDEAAAEIGRAIASKPDYPEAYTTRGMISLIQGRYREGWEDYEWRNASKSAKKDQPHFDLPVWRGEAVEGRHLLVVGEQGLGDIVQFARYLPLLARRGAKVTFLSQAKLVRLFEPLRAQVALTAAIEDTKPFDYQIPLLSLPHRFGTDAASIPGEVPYLRAEDALVARWSTIGTQGFKIGIAWQGNMEGSADRARSFPLAEFAPLARLPGVRLISLQKGRGSEQIADLPSGVTVETLGADFDAGPDAFIDTAAVMSRLDLVVTSDTSIAHLAGALGRPTWVVLKHVPDWRWLLGREDSPWYPTMRLFRQETLGDWKPVFARMAEELGTLLSRRQASP